MGREGKGREMKFRPHPRTHFPLKFRQNLSRVLKDVPYVMKCESLVSGSEGKTTKITI